MRHPFRRSKGHPEAARLGKRALLLWIAYQSVKGTLTTIFIWAPLAGWYLFQ
jgi:hypothetical protein